MLRAPYRTLLCVALWSALHLTPRSLPSQAPTLASKESALTDLVKELKKLYLIKDPQARILALSDLAKSHAELVRVEGGASNMAFAANDSIKAAEKNPELLEASLKDFVPQVQKDLVGLDYERSSFNYTMARNLLKSRVLLGLAAGLAEAAVEDFKEESIVAHAQWMYDERLIRSRERNRNTKVDPFDRRDAVEQYRRELALRYSLLGDLQTETAHDEAALVAYGKALQLHPDMGAYRGESLLREKHGDKNGALVLLFEAEMTGHLKASDIEHMKQLYLELHPGSNEAQMEKEIDGLYSSKSENPITFTKYVATRSKKPRAVLAEFFTGAACEPCMSPDFAFDAALKRYSRDELVLVVYHDNAPAPDPLANAVTQERSRYYSSGGGTPHGYLDGRPLDLVEGLPRRAQEAANRLFPEIDQEIRLPSDTVLEVSGIVHGNQVDVTAHVQAQPNVTNRRLHLDLIEQQVSYSGENSLRFQPMVVRATAEPTEISSGFEVPASGILDLHYTFDLGKVEAINTVYYTHFDEALRKRTNGLLGADYREKKATINADHLAIAAFVQDDSNKAVLQSAFVNALGGGENSTNRK